MTQDAHSQFVSGQKVTALHLQHMQDRLREGLADIRSCIGLGKVAWGLKAELKNGNIELQPGAAFTLNGHRLSLDSIAQIPIPSENNPWNLLLTGLNDDVELLRHDGAATIINLVTEVSVQPQADTDGSSIVIAQIDLQNNEVLLAQDPEIFAATGNHNHSGEWYQNSLGQWLFDGSALEDRGDAPGIPGPKGALGPVGPQGEQGDIGSQGLMGKIGTKGENGDQGERGPQGERGLQGIPGEKGNLGAPGALGELGPAGDKGEIGERGLAGLSGIAGQRGPMGLKGGPGPQGKIGALGSTGDAGPEGKAGEKGLKGDKGNIGSAGIQGPEGKTGPKGDSGSQGKVGVRGKTGPAGARGEQGIPGEGLDSDWPAIAQISWPHDGKVTPKVAIQLIDRINVKLSNSLSGTATQSQPQVIQVLFESGFNQEVFVMPMSYLQGSCKLGSQQIDWRPRGDTSQLLRFLSVNGGRIFIRIHCGALLGTDSRPFSASCDVLHGTKSPKSPGGVLESWFNVGAQ